MPVKLGSTSTPEREARIEIIPLIDIMFFLLAAFMLVSLSMVNLRSVKVTLPAAATATPETHNTFISISVDRNGSPYLEKVPVGINELVRQISAVRQTQEQARVFISGDADARHGDIVRVLDAVPSAGIQNVSIEIRAPGTTSGANQ